MVSKEATSPVLFLIRNEKETPKMKALWEVMMQGRNSYLFFQNPSRRKKENLKNANPKKIIGVKIKKCGKGANLHHIHPMHLEKIIQ